MEGRGGSELSGEGPSRLSVSDCLSVRTPARGEPRHGGAVLPRRQRSEQSEDMAAGPRCGRSGDGHPPERERRGGGVPGTGAAQGPPHFLLLNRSSAE